MPTFKLPKPSKKEKEYAEPTAFPDYYYRKVTIPVNAEILKTVKVEDEATVTLKGKIKSTRSNDPGSKEICIEIEEVSVYGEGEYEKLAKDEDED